jgi:hypothetical protein
MLMRESMVLAIALTLTCGMSALAQQPVGTLEPSSEHKKLQVFVGAWNDQAEVKPTPFRPGGKMSIAETCDWFTGRFSVVCNAKTTGLLGDLKTLIVLTYDSEERVFRLYEFNSVGRSNAAKGTVDRDTWTFNGESKVDGKLIRTRSTIRVTSLDSAAMKSELSVEDGPWTLVMALAGTRAKQTWDGFQFMCTAGQRRPAD